MLTNRAPVSDPFFFGVESLRQYWNANAGCLLISATHIGDFRVAERLAKERFALPVRPELNSSDIDPHRRRNRRVVRQAPMNEPITPSTVPTAPTAPADNPVCGIGDEGAAALREQIHLHHELGLTGLELRMVDGLGIHQLSDAQALAAAEAVAAAGLVVPVVDSPLGSWSVNVGVSDVDELGVLRRTARNARLFGCRHLRIMSYPSDGRPCDRWRAEALRKVKMLTKAAEDLDVVLLHENCSGWAGTDARRTAELIAEVDSPRLRLLFDLGNGLAYGYPSLPFLRAVLPWVQHVHIKDGVIIDGDVVFGLPGEGDAQLTDCLQLLANVGYRGWYSVEPHVASIPHLDVSGDPDRMRTAYRHYVQRFRKLLDGVLGTRSC